MPKGFSIPVKVNQNGGIALSDSDENDAKTIKLALGADDNENAFQQNIGLGEGMVFSISDTTSRAKIVRRLIEIFRRFQAQQRFILRENTIRWEQDSNNQVSILSFKYVQIESDQEKEFRLQYSRPDASGSVT